MEGVNTRVNSLRVEFNGQGCLADGFVDGSGHLVLYVHTSDCCKEALHRVHSLELSVDELRATLDMAQ